VEVSGDLSEQIVDAIADVFGSHPRSRALHAKGFYCDALFEATPEAAALSRAPHLQGGDVPALVRFSTASGDPDVHDGRREGRGMAVKFDLGDGAITDLLCVTSPTFLARNPEDFLELMRARRPDPETGEPDLERLGAYLQEHPEALPAVQATAGLEPPASFAALAYNSLHAFRLVNAAGDGRWVRYRWEPPGGERRIPDEEAMARDPGYLRAEMEERLAVGPAELELSCVLGEEGDAVDDPTAPWPEERERVALGALRLQSLVADQEEGGDIVVFDPVNVVDGIELPDDPILYARSAAYTVSAARRA
jgi:catalase